jgi:hypothetical protein
MEAGYDKLISNIAKLQTLLTILQLLLELQLLPAKRDFGVNQQIEYDAE